MRARVPENERTSFQESSPWTPETDSKADVAIVYGLNPSFEDRVEQWRSRGYRIHVMTGVAWGDYADYVRGVWDGVPHFEDAQTETGDFRIEHGIGQGHDIYYMIPSRPYPQFLSERLRRVVDAGALALHLEEPEFWSRAGYGAGFEREWLEFFGEPWQDPACSPDARYRASKLMQYLYTRALTTLFSEIKAYAREKGNPNFKCYVPTHSLINYAHWHIVSPESQLLSIPDCDGIIAQVWTGTSRTPTLYRGVRRQRTFESGLCEYATAAGMVRGSGRRLWQLADPIEDNPHYSWEDYRTNWECTVTASLLALESENFEIMPWPRRIFLRDYPAVNLDSLPLQPLLNGYLNHLLETGENDEHAQMTRAIELYQHYVSEESGKYPTETIGFANLAEDSEEVRFGDVWRHLLGFYKQLAAWPDQTDAQRIRSALTRFYHDPAVERVRIPPEYWSELQIIFNALADIDHPQDTEVVYGSSSVGLLLSDSIMYQRGNPEPSDPDLSSFYGLALPLVKNGVTLRCAHLERIQTALDLAEFRILLLTYEGQKPLSAQVHSVLLEWIRQGGALLLFGEGDAYDGVREWWNQDGMRYARPQDHLSDLAGLGSDPAPATYTIGQGALIFCADSPAALAHDPLGAQKVWTELAKAADLAGLALTPSNLHAIRRGPYLALAAVDESQDEQAHQVRGTFINLFDPALPILHDPWIQPDTRCLLYDLQRIPEPAWVIASAGRVEEEQFDESSLSFRISGMGGSACVLRARLPGIPISCSVDGQPVDWQWDEPTATVLLRFPNAIDAVPVVIRWA